MAHHRFRMHDIMKQERIDCIDFVLLLCCRRSLNYIKETNMVMELWKRILLPKLAEAESYTPDLFVKCQVNTITKNVKRLLNLIYYSYLKLRSSLDLLYVLGFDLGSGLL